jgi:hypothetical protein
LRWIEKWDLLEEISFWDKGKKIRRIEFFGDLE